MSGSSETGAPLPYLDGEIREGRHVMQIRVYYEDTDFSGIVYHANFLRFMERGRTNYLRLLGAEQSALFAEAASEVATGSREDNATHQKSGFAFVVRSMQIEFLKPARMDDILTVITRSDEIRGASMMLAQEIRLGEELLMEARVKVAFVSGGRARPIPKALRIAMKADQTHS
ncbi:MAG: tol-pal system-associated acyl-CoA thioesterase [Afipia sp.]|nr:tol-pal system-associated acyl-CoA thioesterase [Afipia sp.]OJW65633.1 MAG: 4-hydroxybenzoyl-CoA thioesterase [Afipia sp. 64-13]